MSFTIALVSYFIAFFLYGIYAASTEGIAKAWISNIASREETATAIGMFSGFQSICVFVASSMTGLIWYQFGVMAAFIITSGMALVVFIYFLLLREPMFNQIT
jgi:MFS family permease